MVYASALNPFLGFVLLRDKFPGVNGGNPAFFETGKK